MAQFASSNFNGTEGDTLSTFDANWVQHPSFTTGTCEIVANRARITSTNSAGYTFQQAAPAGADYSVSLDLYHPGTVTGSTMGPSGRMSTSANTYYVARISVAGTLQLFKFVAGTATSLGSTTRTVTSGGTYRMELRMTGTTIELWWDGEGTAAVSTTDSAISAAGWPGIRSTASTPPTDSLSWQIDNFSADEAGGGATNYSLTADVGAYSLTGIDAGLTFARRLLADVGSYSLTGVDATLTYVPASGAYTLTADTGAYSLTGNDAGLTFARSMTADVGSYTLNGVDAGLLVGRRLTADTGAYSLAGVDADLIYTALGPTAYALTAETGSYVLGGNAAGLTYTDGGVLIDTHDGFWAKEWARIRAREKRKYREEIEERVEEIQDEIAEVEQQIVEVKQAPKPKQATPARDVYAEQARIVEHLIARRNQLIDEEDEELLLLL